MKEALERMGCKVRRIWSSARGTIAARAQQVKAGGGGVESLGKTGTGAGAFDEFRRMEDKVENAEHTILAQSEADAALAADPARAACRAQKLASNPARWRAVPAPSPGAPAKSEVDDELSALKQKDQDRDVNGGAAQKRASAGGFE